MFHGSAGWALKVFFAEALLGGKRGDLTAATRQIVRYQTRKRTVSRDERERAYQTLKRAVSRYKHLRAFAHGHVSLWAVGAEIGRRISGMPDDVRDVILNDYGADLLEFLRTHRIDGTCPQWLIDAVHSGVDLLSPN